MHPLILTQHQLWIHDRKKHFMITADLKAKLEEADGLKARVLHAQEAVSLMDKAIFDHFKLQLLRSDKRGQFSCK